jgi:hypothetical protein
MLVMKIALSPRPLYALGGMLPAWLLKCDAPAVEPVVGTSCRIRWSYTLTNSLVLSLLERFYGWVISEYSLVRLVSATHPS